MGHKHNHHRKKKRQVHSDNRHHHKNSTDFQTAGDGVLEIVLKCASEGSREAIRHAVGEIEVPPDATLQIISSGTGTITKSDILLAETAGRLIIGYEIEVDRSTEEEIKKAGVEVRLYRVIYRLLEDLKEIAKSLVENVETERILGQAKVIALFKSSRKGVILGCEVQEGRLARGDRFRVIGAMGQIYEGRIESLHIEESVVESAGKGRQVGLKIRNFDKAVIGDRIESVKQLPVSSSRWAPVPGVQTVV